MRSLTLGCAVLALAISAACNNSPVAPVNLARFSQTDLVVGTGAPAAAGHTLTVHYAGWLYNDDRPDQKGAPVDSSAGFPPFVFTLGQGQVIVGWDVGLVGMQAGGKRRLVIPPSMAYGGTRRGTIPPNATLIFEIDLLSIE